MIDRALVAAYDAGMQPLLCLTKADLADPRAAVHVPVARRAVGRRSARVAACPAPEPVRRPGQRARRARGIGKSTLVNALVPDADREIGARQRRHRTRAAHVPSASCCSCRPEGWIIDTPGIRSFGLAHVRARGPGRGVADLDGSPSTVRAVPPTPRDEPECGLDEAMRRHRPEPEQIGRIPPAVSRGSERLRLSRHERPASGYSPALQIGSPTATQPAPRGSDRPRPGRETARRRGTGRPLLRRWPLLRRDHEGRRLSGPQWRLVPRWQWRRRESVDQNHEKRKGSPGPRSATRDEVDGRCRLLSASATRSTRAAAQRRAGTSDSTPMTRSATGSRIVHGLRRQ